MKLINLFIIAQIIILSLALFKSDSAVVKLTDQNFKSLVLESDQLWLVEFYAPWCGHCKKSAPQFEKAAEILQGIINLGAVDVPDNSATGQDYGVSSYPTIKFFGSDKKQPIDFSSGDRSFEKFVSYSLGKARSQINSRLKSIENSSGSASNAAQQSEL